MSLLLDTPAPMVKLHSPWARLAIPAPTPGLRAILEIMANGGATEEKLTSLFLQEDGAASLPHFYYYMRALDGTCLLYRSLYSDTGLSARVVPLARGFEFINKKVQPGAKFRLSRFAYCRLENNAVVLESPLSLSRTELHGVESFAAICQLSQICSSCDLSATISGLKEQDARAFLGLLLGVHAIAEAEVDGTLAEDRSDILAQWEFHDLLFHSRSRMGRHDYEIGGTFPFMNKSAPLPALKPQMSEDVIQLYKPDIELLSKKDAPFTCILEDRRSIRSQGECPITGSQLGEFLYRVGRVRHVIEPDIAGHQYYQATDRPYPSGGATFELEIYVVITECMGIAPGIYHYDALNHQICKLSACGEKLKALLRNAQQCSASRSEPQVLIVISSRFQRVSWKYRSIAYSMTLKNVGVLYQTMYLVATAMGLAGCALGSGNATLFADIVGTDYFAESSVGEFILGSTC